MRLICNRPGVKSSLSRLSNLDKEAVERWDIRSLRRFANSDIVSLRSSARGHDGIKRATSTIGS